MTRLSWVALALVLVAYPVVYCSGVMGGIVRPLVVEHSRAHWWQFWWANILFHGVPFLAVWIALARAGETWASVGVDWSAFWRRRWAIAAVLVVLAAAAFVMPKVHYGDSPPTLSRTIFLGPVSTGERLWIILIAAMAGVTEEVLFRGFAITRLTRVLGSPWLALVPTVIAFLFIHGTPRDTGGLVAYTLAGLAFGIPFILMGMKRLEVLITIHFGIDASMVFAP